MFPPSSLPTAVASWKRNQKTSALTTCRWTPLEVAAVVGRIRRRLSSPPVDELDVTTMTESHRAPLPLAYRCKPATMASID
nr:hypothetical protein Iba_chr08aCG13970 [Ipomoea batatas]